MKKVEDQSKVSAQMEANVTGRVQMVMFRDFTLRRAKKLGLSGTVQNLSDGSVKVVARGDRANLEKFLEALHKGPAFAKVGDVSVAWGSSEEISEGFRIVY